MRKYKRRKRATKTIEELYDNPLSILFIHYSCENLYVIEAGKTPRITSIAIRFLNTGQAKSFSMHISAEIKKIPMEDIQDNYNEIEKAMLDDYFRFVKKHQRHKWIHWKMRDANYGFEAIENRYRVLGGSPISIDDEKKFQLSELLKDKYSSKYIEKPRFYKILEKNRINKSHLLYGKMESQCFEQKEHIKIHKSTLSKTEALENIFIRAAECTLKTNPIFWSRYGYSLQGIHYWFRDNWFGAVIIGVISIFVKTLIVNLFK